MTAILLLTTVMATTVSFLKRARRSGVPAHATASGAASLLSGLVASGLMVAHLVSILLPALAGTAPSHSAVEQVPLAALGVAILIPGLLCIHSAAALTRGELHAQKRTLAAAIVVLGLTAPLAPFQPLALLIAALALVNIGALLSSRTELGISAPAASLHY